MLAQCPSLCSSSNKTKESPGAARQVDMCPKVMFPRGEVSEIQDSRMCLLWAFGTLSLAYLNSIEPQFMLQKHMEPCTALERVLGCFSAWPQRSPKP